MSGVPLEPVYGPDDAERPGQWPYTRGPYASMYRSRLWTMRQFAGFGTAEDTNQRFKDLLSSGGSGLSTAFDMPTLLGRDSDDPLAKGEVGRAGVAIDTQADVETLFSGIDLGSVSTSMTINSAAPVIMAMYIGVGDRTGIERSALSGTIQNDILKPVVVGGIVPEVDMPDMKAAGIAAVLGPGASNNDVVATVRAAAEDASRTAPGPIAGGGEPA